MKKRKQTIVICVVQGKPQVIVDGELGIPATWRTISEALDFTTSGHALVNSAETIYVLDCGTGELEVL